MPAMKCAVCILQSHEKHDLHESMCRAEHTEAILWANQGDTSPEHMMPSNSYALDLLASSPLIAPVSASTVAMGCCAVALLLIMGWRR